MSAPPIRRRLTAVLLTLGVVGLAALGGCAYIGYAAYVAAGNEDTPAAYKGLTGQNVAIMVWADPGIRNDFDTLQADTAMQMQAIFNAMSTGKDASPELAGTKFLDPRAVLRYQEDHPELEGMPVVQIAPRLGVSRVIYVEISTFETHSALSIDLFRGRAMASMKVIEVTGGVGKVAYPENDIAVIYPPKSEEGVPASDTITADKIYSGTVNELAKQLSQRFYKHPKTEDTISQ